MHFLHRRGAAAAAVCASLSIAGWSAVAARSVERDAAAAERGSTARSATGVSAPVEGYMVLLRWRVAAVTDSERVAVRPDAATTESAIAAHREYWSAQRDSGWAILTGAITSDGREAAVIILRATSRAAAERVAAADPAVRADVYEMEVRTLEVQLSPESERPAR